MKKAKQLAQLAEITQVEYNLAQLNLAASRQREADLRNALESLVESRRARANAPLEEADAALIAGADVNWQTWVEQRRRLINLELAQCLAKQDKCREIAQRAFGREQAVLSLGKLHAIKRQRDATRKSTYTS